MNLRLLFKATVLTSLSTTLSAWAQGQAVPAEDGIRVIDSRPRHGDGSAASTEKLTERLEKRAQAEQKHPRRAEVDAKSNHADERVNAAQKGGTISPKEARHLKTELHDIKVDERTALKSNGGSLNPETQKQLDQKLQKESKELRLDKNTSEP